MYVTGKLQQPKTTQRYHTEKIEEEQHKDECLTGQVQQPRTTETFSHKEDRKERIQGQDQFWNDFGKGFTVELK